MLFWRREVRPVSDDEVPAGGKSRVSIADGQRGGDPAALDRPDQAEGLTIAVDPRVKRRQVLLTAVVGIVIFAVTGVAGVAGVSASRDTSSAPTASTGQADGASTARGTIQHLPPQSAGLIYGDPDQALKFATPGGLVVAGRDNFQGRAFKDVSASGGTVLMYLDPIIDNSHGRYHDLLIGQSECGPPTTLWPGTYRANSWGYLNDFRPGSVLQGKVECVLEKMVEENPHMAGWFADDLGSRSYFPGFDWASFPDKAAYRDGAIALTKTFREVADRHQLVFLVNGTWAGGSLATVGGGYPNQSKSGNALADGGVVEHHDGEITYFGPYACSKQWAAQSSVTRGKAFNYAVTSSERGTTEYVKSSCFAFVNHQTDYGTSRRWGESHPTGLPSRAG